MDAIGWQAHAEDPVCLIFWLYNTTVWMHLMGCDDDIKDTLHELGSFELIEEILNSVLGPCSFSYALARLSLMKNSPFHSLYHTLRGEKSR